MEGGVIQNITTTNPELEVLLVDYNKKEIEKPIVSIVNTDTVTDLGELFNGELDKDELEVFNELVDEGFLSYQS